MHQWELTTYFLANFALPFISKVHWWGYLPISGLLPNTRIHMKIITVLQSALNNFSAEDPNVYIIDTTHLHGWKPVPIFYDGYSALSAQPPLVGLPLFSRAVRCIFIFRAEFYINYPRRRHTAVIKQTLMKSSPNHFSNIIQSNKTDDAAVISLHVIHFQLVRDWAITET